MKTYRCLSSLSCESKKFQTIYTRQSAESNHIINILGRRQEWRGASRFPFHTNPLRLLWDLKSHSIALSHLKLPKVTIGYTMLYGLHPNHKDQRRRHGGQMVSALDSRSSSPVLVPSGDYCIGFLGTILTLKVSHLFQM